MTDPIADMLTRIRNAAAARRPSLEVPASKAKFTVAKILEKEGYLSKAEKKGERELELSVRFEGGEPVIHKLTRVSTPGRRVYAKRGELPTVLSGNGIAVISTSQGMMTNVEAKARKLGGEIVCEIY